MEEVKKLLEHEIKDELDGLSNINLGSDDYKITVEGLSKLLDKAVELEKLESEADLKANDLVVKSEELDLRKAQIEQEKKDSWIKNGLTALGLFVGTMVTVWGTKKTFQFEETGTITTGIGRSYINKLVPKK